MISCDVRHQVLRCTECGDMVEIPRHVVSNPEALMMAKGHMANQHAACKRAAVAVAEVSLKDRISARLDRALSTNTGAATA